MTLQRHLWLAVPVAEGGQDFGGSQQVIDAPAVVLVAPQNSLTRGPVSWPVIRSVPSSSSWASSPRRFTQGPSAVRPFWVRMIFAPAARADQQARAGRRMGACSCW